MDHQAFLCSGSDVINGAMLITPVDAQPEQEYIASNCRSAWLRWCSVADGVSASGVLCELFQSCNALLAAAGITAIYGLLEDANWLLPYLVTLGFKRVDSVVTLVRSLADADIARPVASLPCSIRPATKGDLASLAILDSKAFDEHWQFPINALKQAITPHTYVTIAVSRDCAVGYQLTYVDDLDAHIIRLAVLPDYQGQGIGAALLTNVLRTLHRDYGTRKVSLNTQLSNAVSQSLYARYGFRVVQPISQVVRFNLQPSAAL